MKYTEKLELGKIFNIARGGSPRPIQNFITNDIDGIPWIIIGDTDEGTKYITSTKKRIIKEGLKKSRMVNSGDFLLTNSMSFGHPYILKISGCIHDGWLVLSPNRDDIDPDYFYYLLGSDTVYQEFKRRASGTTVKNLNIDLVSSVKVSFPPIAEQRRIAAILGKADGIRRKRQEAIRLTEELGRSLFLDMFGDPVTNSKGLETQPLGKIATFLGGGTLSRQNEEYFKGNICWASSKDMGNEVLLGTQEHITQEAIAKSSTKFVPSGTLLVVVKSKILMRYLPVVRTAVDTCFNQDIKAIIPQDLSLNRYLQAHLKLGQQTLLRQARGVNTEGLTLEHLRKYPVLMPPKAMINKFISISEKLDEMIVRKKYSLEESENLFNSLLQRAFRGEL